MAPQTIDNKVHRLEKRVTELEKLPERVNAIETQIAQLRSEMRVEFSAVREEIRAGDAETRRVLGEQISETRQALGERIDETNRHMRVLHEDVISRLAVIQEGQSAARRKRKNE